MTREEAVEVLKKNKPGADPRRCGLELCTAVDMAIAALREQDATDTNVGHKTEPCPWCKRGWDWSVIDGDFGQYVHPSMIKHCFRCGRRLEEV